LLAQQNKKIDSLLIIIKTDNVDTNKVIHLYQLTSECKLVGDYKNGMIYGTEAIELAHKLGFEKGIENAYYNIGIDYFFQGDYHKALDCFFKTLVLLEQHGKQQTLTDKGVEANVLQSVGAAYFKQGDYAKALDYYFKALKTADELRDKSIISTVLSGIGITYRYQANYTKALEYDFKGLKLKEEMGDKRGIAAYLGNIGMIYNMQGDFKKALEYRFKALQVAEELKDKSVIAENTGNIGVVYSRQASGAVAGAKDSLYNNARDYYFKALHITEKLGNKNTSALWLSIIGNTYQIQSRSTKLQSKKKELLNKALDYCFKSLKIKEELGNKLNIATDLSNIGSIYIESENYAEAEKYLLHAVDIEKEIGALEQEMNCENILSDFYAKRGQPMLALEHYKKANALNDTLFNAENSQKIANIQFTYEQEKKDKIHELEQKAEEQQHKVEIEKQKIVTWSVASGLLLVLVFAGFIFNSLRITRRQKNIIELQKNEVSQQKEIVEEKQKEIVDSITYARRIQRALLTNDEYIKNNLSAEYFILFKPKDIVSGDFYWAYRSGESRERGADILSQLPTSNSQLFYIATADCTGHGVPGAFMSMLNISYLNENIIERGIRLPHDILNAQRTEIIKALNPPGSKEVSKDGMDCILCAYDFDKMLLHFAAANNPLWRIRNGELTEYKADKMPIGKYTEEMQSFNLQTIELQKGDIIYTSTDGFADQFGVNGKKLMKKKFKEELFKIHHLQMDEQKEYLDRFFENWKGNTEQVDDVCIIGVKI
jgi:serine phosphatase RsbU (regulator of sigma subunit)